MRSVGASLQAQEDGEERAQLLGFRELSGTLAGDRMASAGSVLLLQRWLFIVACLRLLSGALVVEEEAAGKRERAQKRAELARPSPSP